MKWDQRKLLQKPRQEVWALTSVVKIGKKEEGEHYWKGRTDRCDSSLWWRERTRESQRTLRLMEGEWGNWGNFSTTGSPGGNTPSRGKLIGHFQMCDVGKCHFQGMVETRKCNYQKSSGWAYGRERMLSVVHSWIYETRDKSVSNNSDGVGRAAGTRQMGLEWPILYSDGVGRAAGTRQMGLEWPTVSLHAHGYTEKKEGCAEGLGMKSCLGYPGRGEIEPLTVTSFSLLLQYQACPHMSS